MAEEIRTARLVEEKANFQLGEEWVDSVYLEKTLS